MEQSTIRGINHIGVVVPDLDEATHFLENALGAKVIRMDYEDDTNRGAGIRTNNLSATHRKTRCPLR